MVLIIPTPEVKVEGLSGNAFVAEKPMNLSCAAVTFADGTLLEPAQAQLFGFRLQRKQSDGSLQLWSEADKAWVSESAAPEPESLAYKDALWQTVLVAMGQQDQAGLDKFATDRLSGFPRYAIRCLFSATDGDGVRHEGSSPPSAEFTVSAAGELDRAGLTMQPEESAQAEEIRLFLKDTALAAEQGVIAIRQQGSGFEIELRVSGASVILGSSGDIALTAATGRSVALTGDVTIDGDLSVQDRLTVAGVASLAGGASVSGALDISGNVSILGTLRVNGVVMTVP